MLSCVMKLQAADYANWKLQQLICTLQTDPQSEDPLHAIFTANHLVKPKHPEQKLALA